MATNKTRVVLDRRALEEAVAAVGVGAYEFAVDVIEGAAQDAPDATPYGVGLVTGGGAVGFANGKQVGAWAADGLPEPPRDLGATKTGQVAVAGGFRAPGRFQELGTVNHGAQPFLSPALQERLPHLNEYIAAAVKRSRAGGKGKK